MRYKVKLNWWYGEIIEAHEVSCMGGFLVFFDEKGAVITHYPPGEWLSFRSLP